MKKSLITTGLLLAAIAAFAQSPNVMVFTNERPIGRMIATQEEIKAKEYIFPERIYRSYIDTTLNSIIVQLRGLSINGKRRKDVGKIVYYDLTEKRIKWSKNINYTTSSLQQFGSAIIYTTNGTDFSSGKNFRLNNENGKNLWKATNNIYFVDYAANIGVGYRLGSRIGYGNALEGIDLETGKAMWQRELNREYGWNGAFRLNDSEWMIVSARLHTVNTHNGAGWSYNAITAERVNHTITSSFLNYGNTITLVRSEIMELDSNIYPDDNLGIYMFIIKYNLMWDIVSNVYSDSSGYYLASKDMISRINKNDGTIKWYSLFPDGYSSKSSIWGEDNRVFMLNYGYAFQYSLEPFNHGTPFFAAFDKENGEQKFLSIINIQKNPILDFIIENEYLLLVFKDRLMKYSLSDGAQILDKTVDNKELGELRGFVGNRVYIEGANSTLANLTLSDISKNYIITSANKILIIDDELNIVGETDVNQLYTARLRIDDYLIVTKDNKTFILDADNKKIAEIDIALKPVLIGSKLYSIQENSFFEIDLENIISNSAKTRELISGVR